LRGLVAGHLAGMGLKHPRDGRARVNRIKRYTEQVFAEHKAEFGLDFAENRRALKAVATVRSKELQNEIAGYITRTLKRERREIEERRRRAAADAEQERASIDEEIEEAAPEAPAGPGPAEGRAFSDGGAVVMQEDPEGGAGEPDPGGEKPPAATSAAGPGHDPYGVGKGRGGGRRVYEPAPSAHPSTSGVGGKHGGDKPPLTTWSQG